MPELRSEGDGMSEYIITSEQIEELNKAHGGMQIVTSWLSAYAIFDTSTFPPLMKSQHLAITLPSVVLCRDCKRFKPREGATLNCRFEHPSMPNTVEWCYAEPDGFCKWGERS